MIADYVVTLDRTEHKVVETEKILHGEAQIDIFLCNNPACDVGSDIVMVEPNSSPGAAVHALAQSTIKNTRMAVPYGTARQLSSSTLDATLIPTWLAATKGSGVAVHQLKYTVIDPTWTDQPVDVMPLAGLSQLLNTNQEWASLQYGVYHVQELYKGYSYSGSRAPLYTGCAIVILPASNPWLNMHGWNQSHKGCNATEPLPVFVFGSYFWQAQFLGGRATTTAVGVQGVYSGQSRIPAYFSSVQYSKHFNLHNGSIPYNTVQQQISMAVQYWSEYSLTNRSDYSFAGRYGPTLSCDQSVLANSPKGLDSSCRVVTQEQAGCITGGSAAEDCSVLVVGTAAIAVWPVPTLAAIQPAPAEEMFLRSSVPLPRMSPASKLHGHLFELARLGQYNNGRDASSRRIDQATVPWCYDGILDLPTLNEAASNGLIKVLDLNDCGVDSDSSIPPPPAGTVFHCDFWEELGVGYADRSWDANHESVQQQHVVGSRPFSDLLEVKWLDITKQSNLLSSGGVPASQLQAAISGVLVDGISFLSQHASQELATMDATKTWRGALLDITTTLVAVVALAAGCDAMPSLFIAWLNFTTSQVHVWYPWSKGVNRCTPDSWLVVALAKTVAVLVVIASLILQPCLNLAAAHSVHADSAKGTSLVGWLAADTSSGEGPFMVVGVAAVQLQPGRSELAFGLMILNLVFALIAACCIGAIMWRKQPMLTLPRWTCGSTCFGGMIQSVLARANVTVAQGIKKCCNSNVCGCVQLCSVPCTAPPCPGSSSTSNTAAPRGAGPSSS